MAQKLSTVQEDFAKIGLIKVESEGSTPISKQDAAPGGDPSKNAEPKIVGKEPETTTSITPDEKPTEVPSPAPGTAEGAAPPATPVVETPPPAPPAVEGAVETEPELSEAFKLLRKRRLNAKAKVKRRKLKMKRRRQRSKLRLKSKKFRRSAAGKRFKRKYKIAKKRTAGKNMKMKRITLRAGLDRIANMIEDAEAFLSGEGESFDVQETIKSYANVAIISEMLSERLKSLAEDDAELTDLAEEFGQLASECADIAEDLATTLKEGEEADLDEESIAEHFEEALEGLMGGLDLYADLTEGEDEEDDDDDEEEEEDDEEGDEKDPQ